MSQGFTIADVIAREIRMAKGKQSPEQSTQGVEAEGELQQAIIDECKRRMWVPIYQRMDKPTRGQKGQPDLIIFADNSRVFIIEAKSKSGKLRPEQLGYKLMLEKLGHTVHIIRDFASFIKIIIQPETL